jgi:hypothetical protein
MAVQLGSAADDTVVLTLFDDMAHVESRVSMSKPLARLCAYADAWARKESRQDPATLTFSSTLAAMAAGEDELCGWFRLHLALRGSNAAVITKNRTFPGLEIPTGRLTTTISFRKALEQATALAAGRPLDVRHMMAAYPVIKAYHTENFLSLRIDRRAWCLALAGHLQRTKPDERHEWIRYELLAPEVLLPRYRPDLPAGADLLGVGREVEAFSMLIASAWTAMPLSIGVFGAWGSGKSYFMARMEERVAALSRAGDRGAPYLQRIAQVRFNAWHYSEGDVVASLVDQIFRNLRFGPDDSSLMLAQRRAAAMAQVTAADEQWHAVQTEADAAAVEEARLRQEWEQISAAQNEAVQQTGAQLSAAQTAATEAQQSLDTLVAAQAAAIDAARAAAPVQSAARVVTDTILSDPTIAKLDADVRTAADSARWLGVNAWTIACGVVVVTLTAIGMALVPVLRDSKFVTALGALIVAATPWAANAMRVARELAAKGADFQKAVQERTATAIQRIKDDNAARLADHEKAVDAARKSVDALRARIQDLAAAAQEAKRVVEDGERRRQEAAGRLATAAAAAAEARRTLEKVTLGSLLGDTIREAGDTDVFRKRLGTLTVARSYFQRLSETMKAARDEFAEDRSRQPPVLERVVLYIDDLDRCPENKVREVLQAVHLLLAFDLFVCVVAVDPRWILQSLEESPGVTFGAASKDSDLAVLGGVTTPSDYLEKIFQIPLWLRPVPADRRAALAATLLARDIDQGDRAASIRDDRLLAIERAAVLSTADPASVNEVHVLPAESEFLHTRVAPLLDGNSRALKRFVNTYHLVKAALSEVEFGKFAYQVCMAQLALLATERQRARALAKLVDDTSRLQDGTLSLGVWLKGLAASDRDAGSIARDLEKVLLPDFENLPFERFAFWFERTRRYSFYL